MKQGSNLTGYLNILQAFVMWGLLTIYWKSLKHIGPWELLSHRVIWAFVLLTIYLVVTKKTQFTYIWKNKKVRYNLLTTSFLIAMNWGVFIYAVNTDKILQAGLGYYITPLVNMFLGITILKEKLTKAKSVALLLVTGAILFLTLRVGEFPYISFTLAFSFGFYGLIKKTTQVNTLPSLAFETTVLLPLAIGYQVYLWATGNMGAADTDSTSQFLLVGTGIITVLPLYWFTKGAKIVPLTTVGFFQYVAPSIMLLIGVFAYNEPFRKNEIIAFSIIWVAISIYIYSLISESRKTEIASDTKEL